MIFNGICLITRDVSALADFYARVLGAEVEGDEVHAELRTEGVQLAIFSVDGMEDMAPGSMQGVGSGNITLGFEVEDVDVEYERIKTYGVQFILLPKTHPWGARSFWFRDPDGNIVDFFSRQVSPFLPGMRVRILEGSFKEFRGKVVEANPVDKRVKVLVDFFGQPREVEFTYQQIVEESAL